MRVGVYGGSFNPIHAAHMALLDAFARRLALDRVLLIPAGVPPHKDVPELASGEDRLQMCRIAARSFAPCPMEVLDMEITRGGKSYTADTLTALKNARPEDQLFFLVGEDMFLTLQDWRRPEEIFAAAVLCGVPRTQGGFDRMTAHSASLKARYPEFSCTVLQMPVSDLSSTEIRARCHAGEDIEKLVPPGVSAYIRERGLYR